MASITNDPNGRRRIQFVAPDGARKTVRLGKCDKRTAEGVCRHVEGLLAARISSQPVHRDTAAWLAEVAPALRDKLAAVGLIEPERRLTVGEPLTTWLESKRAAGHAVAAILDWQQSVTDMQALFGERPLAALTHADGERYRDTMLTRGLRATTIHKRLGHARQMLEDAVRLEHL